MRNFILVASFLIVVLAVAIFLGDAVLISKPQVQNGFTAVGKMLDSLDTRIKALEDKK